MRCRGDLDEDALTRPRLRTGFLSRPTPGRGALLAAAVSLALVWGCGSATQTSPYASLDSIVDAWIAEDHASAATLLIVDREGTLHSYASGVLQRYSFGTGQYPGATETSPRGITRLDDPSAVTTTSIFDLASVTKVMATTAATMLLVDQGSLDLDTPVANYLPDFAGGGREGITARHLLTHTSGLPQWWPVYYHAGDRESAWAWLRTQPTAWPVGSERHYSDLGFMTLGRLVEEISGTRLDRLLEQELYGPLGLTETGFRPRSDAPSVRPAAGIVATSHGNPFERRMVHDSDFGYDIGLDGDQWSDWRTHTLVGDVNDGNAWHAFEGVAGHAGLFSSAPDLGLLMRLLLRRGEVDGQRIVSAKTVDHFLAPQLEGQALGWQLPGYAPEGSFGHTGFTGTFVLGVPSAGVGIVLLTNRQNGGVDADTQYPDVGPLQRAIVAALLNRP